MLSVCKYVLTAGKHKKLFSAVRLSTSDERRRHILANLPLSEGWREHGSNMAAGKRSKLYLTMKVLMKMVRADLRSVFKHISGGFKCNSSSLRSLFHVGATLPLTCVGCLPAHTA